MIIKLALLHFQILSVHIYGFSRVNWLIEACVRTPDFSISCYIENRVSKWLSYSDWHLNIYHRFESERDRSEGVHPQAIHPIVPVGSLTG